MIDLEGCLLVKRKVKLYLWSLCTLYIFHILLLISCSIMYISIESIKENIYLLTKDQCLSVSDKDLFYNKVE